MKVFIVLVAFVIGNVVGALYGLEMVGRDLSNSFTINQRNAVRTAENESLTCYKLGCSDVVAAMSGTMTAVNDYTMQPFGDAKEDEVTARDYAQPVDYNNGQVTLNGVFLQPGVQ